jgi:hypothetical protein
MSEFLIGVISSLAATGLTVGGGWFASHRVRQWPIAVLSRLTGLAVRRVYRAQSVANRALRAEITRARWVRVLAGRGNELTRDSFGPLWTKSVRRLEFAQILLPDPSSAPGSWLGRREADMQRLDPGLSTGQLADQVRVNATYVLTATRGRQDIELRLYDLPNLYRAIITDNVAYLTVYNAAEHGRNSPCIVARKPGLMYDLAMFVFRTAWDSARSATD